MNTSVIGRDGRFGTNTLKLQPLHDNAISCKENFNVSKTSLHRYRLEVEEHSERAQREFVQDTKRFDFMEAGCSPLIIKALSWSVAILGLQFPQLHQEESQSSLSHDKITNHVIRSTSFLTAVTMHATQSPNHTRREVNAFSPMYAELKG